MASPRRPANVTFERATGINLEARPHASVICDADPKAAQRAKRAERPEAVERLRQSESSLSGSVSSQDFELALSGVSYTSITTVCYSV